MPTYEGFAQVAGFVFCYGEANSVEEFKAEQAKRLQQTMRDIDSVEVVGWEEEPTVSELSYN